MGRFLAIVFVVSMCLGYGCNRSYAQETYYLDTSTGEVTLEKRVTAVEDRVQKLEEAVYGKRQPQPAFRPQPTADRSGEVKETPRIDYAEALRRVENGERFILAIKVRPKIPYVFYGTPVYEVTDPPAGTVPGHYQCSMKYGVPVWWRQGMEEFEPIPQQAAQVVQQIPFVQQVGSTDTSTPVSGAALRQTTWTPAIVAQPAATYNGVPASSSSVPPTVQYSLPGTIQVGGSVAGCSGSG